MVNFAAAVATYTAGGGQTALNWDAIRTSSGNLYTPFKNALDTIWVSTPAGDFAGSEFAATNGEVNDFNSQSVLVEGAALAVTSNPTVLGDADAYAVAAAGQSLPSVASLTTNLDSLVTSFTPLGTPYSTVSSMLIQPAADAVNQCNQDRLSLACVPSGLAAA
jgi:hypothetical protein